MDARVVLVNRENRRVAARNFRSQYTIFNVLDGPMPEVGDLVRGLWDKVGIAEVQAGQYATKLSVQVTHSNESVAFKAKSKVND